MQNVHLFFSSQIQHEDASQQIEFNTQASYILLENGGVELSFEEQDAHEQHMITTVVIYPNRVFIYREGVATMKQHFILGKQENGTYHTEFGSFAAKAHTHELTFLETKKQYVLTLIYDYFLNDVYTGKVNLELKYSKGEQCNG